MLETKVQKKLNYILYKHLETLNHSLENLKFEVFLLKNAFRIEKTNSNQVLNAYMLFLDETFLILFNSFSKELYGFESFLYRFFNKNTFEIIAFQNVKKYNESSNQYKEYLINLAVSRIDSVNQFYYGEPH